MKASFRKVSNINMEPNITIYFMSNESVNSYNSDVPGNGTLSLDDLNKSAEQGIYLGYKSVAIIIGLLAVFLNLIVVISSGLILRKGQEPKSTYLLLGNVSLADMMVGFFLIISSLGGQTLVSSGICMFKTGMVACPSIVSVFTVAFIAIDRYCYILHGLYYHRYFTTRRVRISIAVTWIIGLTIGFLPGVGWVNRNVDEDATCSYLAFFPDILLLFNAFLTITIFTSIILLYIIILISALRNVKNIKATSIITRDYKDSKLRDPLASVNNHKEPFIDYNSKVLGQPTSKSELKRSASFPSSRYFHNVILPRLNAKSKSNNDLILDVTYCKPQNPVRKQINQRGNTYTEYSNHSKVLSSLLKLKTVSIGVINKERIRKFRNTCKNRRKEPCKLRAIIIVSLTLGSIIITWMPFFLMIILYVLCENKSSNVRCSQYKMLLEPFLTLAFLNSLLNPFIYAWWHKGFKRSVKNYFRRIVLSIKVT